MAGREVPLSRVDHHRADDQGFHAGRQVGPSRARPLVDAFGDVLEDGVKVVVLEGPLSRHALVQDGAEGVLVALGVGLPRGLQLFGRQIENSAEGSPGAGEHHGPAVTHHLRNAEVEHLGLDSAERG